MLRIIVHGCCGKMGKVLAAAIKESSFAEMTAGIDAQGQEGYSLSNPSMIPCYTTFGHCRAEADVVIDFSNPACLSPLLAYCTEKKLPLVIATTGFHWEEEAVIKKAAEEIPIFRSANMSLGINVMARLTRLAAVNLEQDFNVEIIEKHHANKVDSPSGTAFLLAEAVNQGCLVKKDLVYGRHGRTDQCKITDMGVHAVRGGSMPGEHTVLFAGPGETLEITHRALSKDIFAAGALQAAAWLVGKPPALYSMVDLLS